MTPRIVIENLEECFDQEDFCNGTAQSTRNNPVIGYKNNVYDNLDDDNNDDDDDDDDDDDAKKNDSRRRRDHPFPLVPPSMTVSTTSKNPLHLQQQQLSYNRSDKLSHSGATPLHSRHHHHSFSNNVVALSLEDRMEQEQRRKCRRRDRMVASGWVGLVVGLIVTGGPIGLVGSVVGAAVALGVTKVGERRKDARVAKAASLVGTARETL
jgi:hypothetical protein